MLKSKLCLIKKFSSFANGSGGFDAFINAIKKYLNLSFPQPIDYEVRIPVGGHTDALVECKIIWKKEIEE